MQHIILNNQQNSLITTITVLGTCVCEGGHSRKYFNLDNPFSVSYFLTSIRIALNNYDIQPSVKKNVIFGSQDIQVAIPKCEEKRDYDNSDLQTTFANSLRVKSTEKKPPVGTPLTR
jgi:hypothetical protein